LWTVRHLVRYIFHRYFDTGKCTYAMAQLSMAPVCHIEMSWRHPVHLDVHRGIILGKPQDFDGGLRPTDLLERNARDVVITAIGSTSFAAGERKPFVIRRAIYPANNFLGLVANVMLTVTILNLPVVHVSTAATTLSDHLFPLWQQVPLALSYSLSLPIFYFWSASEFRHSTGQLRNVRFQELRESAINYRQPEKVVGTVAFLMMSARLLILIADGFYIPRLSAFPDSGTGTIGLVTASIVMLTVVIIQGGMPWLAVYRGLSDLLDTGRYSKE
jgi:hypothetical protein